MTQSFGPEARGSACQSQLVVSDERVLYPYITQPGVLMALSQEAYDMYEPELPDGGVLIVEEDLVKPKADHAVSSLCRVPATRFAEEIGNRLFTNLVVLGFFSAVTGVGYGRCHEEGAARSGAGPLPEDESARHSTKGYDYGRNGGEAAAVQ